MIKEFDQVALTMGLPEHGLEAGDLGTVVMIHDGGRGYEIEVFRLDGDTYDVVTVSADMVRPVSGREIAHARVVA